MPNKKEVLSIIRILNLAKYPLIRYLAYHY